MANMAKYHEYLEGNDYQKRFAAMLEKFNPDTTEATWGMKAGYKACYEYHNAKAKETGDSLSQCKSRKGIYASLSERDLDETLKYLCYARRGHALKATFWKRAYGTN